MSTAYNLNILDGIAEELLNESSEVILANGYEQGYEAGYEQGRTDAFYEAKYGREDD